MSSIRPEFGQADTTGKPITIFARFTGQEILSEMGRLVYAVLNTFSQAGHRILLYDNLELNRVDEERPYLQTIHTIENLSLVKDIPANSRDLVYLFDLRDEVLTGNTWKKTIQVGFDIYSSHFITALRGIHPVMMPYPMHPLLYNKELSARLEAARRHPRKVRIFFSGDTRGYRRNRVHYPESKLTRSQIVAFLRENIGEILIPIEDEQNYQQLRQGPYQNGFALVDNEKYRIPPQLWLESLALGDFFLAPPGYVMPMCHNIIEAMAVGAIPLTNYPEWLNPSLEDGINCIAFNDRHDLLSKVQRIMSMNSQQIAEMKSNVIDYYHQHLDTGRFARRLDNMEKEHILLLMITDSCVAKNPGGLNAHSILMSGRARRPSDIWQSLRHTFGF
jgi:hypothetical protein